MIKKVFLSLISLLFVYQINAQNYYFATPQGYGAATTGGGNATPVTVTTWANLRTQMQSAGSKVILVSGVITVPANQQLRAVITNKSLIGLPGARLVSATQAHPGGGIIYLRPGSNNVIIRNIIFEGPGAYDTDGEDSLTADGCTNLWVDHCEFQDGLDGNFDMKGNTDNVTVSWCKFTYLKPPLAGGSGGSNDHRFSNLVGSGSNDAPADGHFSVTFQNCFWGSGCRERMPRARNAQLHILNCYYNTGISNSRALGLGGGANNTTCYVENTDFTDINNVYTSYNNSDGGTVALSFNNCLDGANNIGTVAAPTYTATTVPVNEVQGLLTDATCGAGATLQVSAEGVISPNECESLNVIDYTENDFIRVYPTIVKNNLTIEIKIDQLESVQIELFNSNGQHLKKESKTTLPTENITLELENLSSGLYFGRVIVNHKTHHFKFIKS
ncbi:T9SS type A sorting domain-containing protein [Flavobacterium azooxidireducens]|uniref:T9SS type A sorting domain-containing protein n=1 Tax=Flavobacterium azooxidireducens TaxID=1871076 RepID=A0ABY4KHF0_9FLAO|nr:T9SS type A sorting domain-containing protein [Flavobacterium azooxidireducens]UPQ78835.1 T9SS type A sorting domain-containing protein [Flavobacterium azooxidireducens]